MTITEIRAAVDAGQIVRWQNDSYTVVRDALSQYQVKCNRGSCIGLTWADGVTLNGAESEFYVEETATPTIHTHNLREEGR